MLTRLDDKLIDHDKVIDAAEKLGKYGYERAYGATVWAIQYANNHGTDGFLPAHKVAKRINLQTAAALVEVNLWEACEGGYRVHDFLDWNPSSAEVKARQKRDRERKKKAAGYVVESVATPDAFRQEIHAESDRSSSHAPAGQDRTGQGQGSIYPETSAPSRLVRAAPKNAVFAGVFVVPDWLDGEFERKSGWDYATRMAWYHELDDAWQGRQIGESDPSFLRKRFEERIGATPKANTRTTGNQAVLDAVLGRGSLQ